MQFEPEFAQFWERVKESLTQYTFAKLTLAKTIGDTPIKNIFMRPVWVEGQLKFSLLSRFKTEEIESFHTLDEAYQILLAHMNQPFLTALLFTSEADITFKLNKKRVASILVQAPTFKYASEVVAEMQSKKMIVA